MRFEKNSSKKFVNSKISVLLCRFKQKGQLWPVRLSVRTPGFHPGKRGSIPLRATKVTMKIVTFFYNLKLLQI